MLRLSKHGGGVFQQAASRAPSAARENGDALRVPPWVTWAGGVAIAAAYFSTLGRFALGEPDEPRYAEIAREMVVLHDWVTPHLNYVKYF